MAAGTPSLRKMLNLGENSSTYYSLIDLLFCLKDICIQRSKAITPLWLQAVGKLLHTSKLRIVILRGKRK